MDTTNIRKSGLILLLEKNCLVSERSATHTIHLQLLLKRPLEENTRSLATFHGEYLLCVQCLSGEVGTSTLFILELPCKFVFSTHDAEESSHLRKLISDSLSKSCYGENSAEDSVGEEVVEEKKTGKSSSTENKKNSKPIDENEVNNQLVFDTSKIT